jgi:Tfp pilus assembly protein PilF
VITNLGRLYYYRGARDSAKHWFRQALLVDARQPDALYDMGCCLIDECRFMSAAEYLEKALTSDPEHSNAHFMFGVCHQEMGDFRVATKHFRQHIRLRGAFSKEAARAIGFRVLDGGRREDGG